jgi:hypothetical protein
LTGINDVGLERENPRDERSFGDCRGCSFLRRSANLAFEHSHVLAAGLNLKRALSAHQRGLHHDTVELSQRPHRPLPSSRELASLRAGHEKALAGYRERITYIVELCREHGITPIFITQPALCGTGIEPESGVNLATVESNDGRQSGGAAWPLWSGTTTLCVLLVRNIGFRWSTWRGSCRRAAVLL